MAASIVRSCVLTGLLLAHAGTARAEGEGEAEAEAGEHHHHHANHVALFLGATTGLGAEGTTHFTVGADYERRLPFADHIIGVGALIDSAIASETETLIAPFVAVHPIGGLMLLGAVGVAVTGFGHDGHLALRGGAAYFIPVGGFSAGPEVSIDHVSGETAVVYGVSLGAGF